MNDFETHKKPTAIDLFAGCGGFSLGLIQAGFKMLVAVELDNGAADTYDCNLAKRYGVRLLRKDITKLTGKQVLKEARIRKGALDLLVGGPPCQGFSTANLNRSVKDPRSRLMWEFIRMVRAIKPKCFMIENVPGLLHFKDFFVLLLSSLERCGYVVRFLMMDAVSYGVPQHRRRVFIQGMRRDQNRLPIFARPTHFAPEQLKAPKHHFKAADIAIYSFAENGFSKEEVNDVWWNGKLNIQMNRKTAADVIHAAIYRMFFDGIQGAMKRKPKRTEQDGQTSKTRKA